MLIKIEELVVQIEILIVYSLVKFRFLDGKNNQLGHPTDHLVSITKLIDQQTLYSFLLISTKNGHKLANFILHNMAQVSQILGYANQLYVNVFTPQ